ncbi:hypothetical protein SAMN04487983_1010218 [Streptomyces sp. yr375]|uniref:DUF6879 family protein n=1 Tax=Streptomyces sp. yr375 TaxID=1761906 RepID=UPI0008C29D0D|nr:DUF6879 family protein [Streptomyces sp. yr375]SER05264.1 hypothetical protein SAMN04487983_1010218 [Streptomyces sp. yr375]
MAPHSYMLDDPEFIAWRQGKRLDPADRPSWWGGWHDVVRDAVSRGVVVRRARVASEPISDFVRYEYDGTFTNIAAGEQVRWLPRRQTTDLALPGTDFWVFDGTQTLFHHFTGDGQLNEDGWEYTDDPVRVKPCIDAFEAVWQRATPHEAYRPR